MHHTLHETMICLENIYLIIKSQPYNTVKSYVFAEIIFWKDGRAHYSKFAQSLT